MGIILSFLRLRKDILCNWNKKRPAKILMLGLDGAGKTTVINQLKFGESTSTMPTIGFNVEAVELESLSMTLWDVGGQEKIRPLWRHYYLQNDALIYVVDCCDTERFTESSQELKEILQSYELRNTPVLILANKQDLPGSANSTEIFQAFDLQNILGERDCHVQESIASDGVGLLEGMQWVAKTIKDSRDQAETDHDRFTCRT